MVRKKMRSERRMTDRNIYKGDLGLSRKRNVSRKP